MNLPMNKHRNLFSFDEGPRSTKISAPGIYNILYNDSVNVYVANVGVKAKLTQKVTRIFQRQVSGVIRQV